VLKRIKIDGFRSLLGFEIELQSGLNVIVGSNGSGKTNFVSFLDFLGELLSGGLNSAIAVAQGAGSVFSKERFSSDDADLKFTIEGETEMTSVDVLYGREPSTGLVKYKYECHIRYLKSVPAVFVAYEAISVSSANNTTLIVVRSTTRDGDRFVSDVGIEPTSHPFYKTAFKWLGLDTRKIDAVAELKKRIDPDKSIVRLVMGEDQLVLAAMLDMISYRSVNIDPAATRKPTPVGSSVALSPTGEGLAGVLYQLERGSYNSVLHYNLFYRPPPSAEEQSEKFRNIMSWCREVNPNIERVSVELDFFGAMFRPSMVFHLGDSIEEFPLARVSDGTVKWLGLTASMFLAESFSVIEEPENFLHPFMQESFVALCRQVIKTAPQRSIIVSTHSPTLLNCCSPRELIIFDLEDGETRASLVANREELAIQIAKSRFGLGYYYRTGGVYGEDRSTRGGPHGDSLHAPELR
jgi:predicted ATPase